MSERAGKTKTIEDLGPSEIAFWPHGDTYDLLDPDPAHIDFGMIAVRMSRIARFVGGTRETLWLTQHSIKVADLVSSPAKPYALLHDAHETFIGGDVARAVARAYDFTLGKRGHCSRPFTCARERLALAWDEAIFKACGLPPITEAIAEEVARIDDAVGYAEYQQLVFGQPHPLLGASFRCWSLEVGEEEFIKALRVYVPLANVSPWPESMRVRHGR